MNIYMKRKDGTTTDFIYEVEVTKNLPYLDILQINNYKLK